MTHLLHRRPRSRGQSLVEFALILPVMLLLVGGAIDLGRLFYSQITIADAAREGALWAVQHPGSWNSGCDSTKAVSASNPNQVVCRSVGEATGGFVTVTAADVSCSAAQPPAVTACAGAIPAAGANVWVTVQGTFKLVMGGVTFNLNSTATGRIAQVPGVSPATAQTISFPAIPDQVLGVGSVNVSATASSGLPVYFQTTTPAVCSASGVRGSTITIDAIGICSVTAFQDGDATYSAAPPLSQSFNVTSPAPPPPGGQTITFAPLPDRALSAGAFVVSATASSGLPVTFTVTTPATCASSGAVGSTITLIALGVCTIQADQAGNATYLAASPVSQSFTITAGAPVCVAPVARFTASPTSGLATKGNTPGTLFTFDGSATTVQAACHPFWSWSFGDGKGTTNTPTLTTYRYPNGTKAGTYTVTLVVTVDGNLSSTTSQPVVIN